MEWLQYFPEHILNRGYDYYCTGAVDGLKMKGDTLTAIVYGSERYDVEITISEGEIDDMYCSCPYADEGNYCKHMAAVLFEWEGSAFNGGDAPVEEDAPDSAGSAAAAVAQADDKTVREFLTQILENDEALFLRFRNCSAPEISAEDMRKYKGRVDSIVRQYQDRHDFIDYHNAGSFIGALEGVLDEDVSLMVDNECYLEAFELTGYIFLTIGKVDIDDSGGGIGELADRCCEIWTDILEQADMDAKKIIFDWFIDHLGGSVVDYMEDYIERILMEAFPEKEFLDAMLDFTEEKAREFKHDKDSWRKDYHSGKWALRHIGLMQSCGSSRDDVERYCKEHWAPSSVRRYFVNQCIEQKDYCKAIEALEESIVLDAGLWGLIKEYSTKLKDLYKRCGEREKYLEQLWRLVLEHDAGSLVIYRELREQYQAEEWKEKREKVFASLQKSYGVDKLYMEERLYDRLLEYALGSCGLYALNEHQSILSKEYPGEVLQKYRDEVEGMARHTAKREHYKELVSILRSMKKITGGSQVVGEIVAHWKSAYANRPAMMDELSRL